MFLTSTFCLYFIFLNFQAYLSFRNSTLASRNYSLCQKIPAKNILLSKNKSSQQQLITTNFECLVAKHTHCITFAPNQSMVFPRMYMHAQMQLTVREFKLQDTCISSPSHYLTSGYLLQIPDNLNCFSFPLKYPLPIYA